MMRGFVTSDLHLLARRSLGEQRLSAILTVARSADVVVLNGDIFDFRWTTLPSIARSIHAALVWLDRLVSARPGCGFHYVLGNHDALQPFADDLAELAALRDNFAWHPTHVKLGKVLFLHGDLVMRGAAQDPFVRPLHRRISAKGKVANSAYDLVVDARLHGSARLLHSRRWIAGRVLASIEAHDRSALDGVTDIYLGHTHVPYVGYRFGGFTFHNTGSAIRHLEGHLLPVEITGPV